MADNNKQADSKQAAVISEPEEGGFAKFLWNSEKSEFLGRTAGSWAKIGIFYVIFYACLAGWFAGLLNVFFLTLSATEPTYHGENSLMQGNPGLGIRPAPIYDTALIRFTPNKPSSFKPYTDHLEAFLANYETQAVEGKDVVDCDNPFEPKEKDDNKACRVDLDKLLPTWCQQQTSFGYDAGKPCLVLKMNKVFGFVPEPYDSLAELMADNELTAKPEHFAYGGNMSVGVSCDGQNAADRENLLNVEFHPKEGISKLYFPYLNQEGYRAPLLLAQVEVRQRVVVQIACKLWAKNIDNSDGQQKHGTLHFELMRD